MWKTSVQGCVPCRVRRLYAGKGQKVVQTTNFKSAKAVWPEDLAAGRWRGVQNALFEAKNKQGVVLKRRPAGGERDQSKAPAKLLYLKIFKFTGKPEETLVSLNDLSVCPQGGTPPFEEWSRPPRFMEVWHWWRGGHGVGAGVRGPLAMGKGSSKTKQGAIV